MNAPFAGRVVSVNFEGGYPAAFQRVPVQGPHWESRLAGELQVPENGSRRPAVYRIGSQVRAEVMLEIAGAGPAGMAATLRGELGGLSLEGDFTLADGGHTVLVTGDAGGAIARHAGDADWFVQARGARVRLEQRTRLEVFAVLDPPAPFFAQGVWGEALCWLVLRAGLSGVADPHEAVRRITRYCHRQHGLRYDAWHARNFYGVEDVGGTFYLSAFLAAAHPLVSCFDLLAAVLVLSGALGVPGRWLTLDGFGFIYETRLVGVGRCNNPRFMYENTPRIIDRDHRDRTSFGQHGFCGVAGRIFDACIGPHLGQEDRQSYLDSVVDDFNLLQLGVPDAASIRETFPAIGLLV